MSTADFAHILFTRFNVKWTERYPFRGHDVNWLEERFELFDRFCVPSVMAQDCRNFHWLVFFDAETPEPFRTRIESYAAKGIFSPAFVSWFDANTFIESLRDLHYLDFQYLITSRVDNDDALAKSYIRRVQTIADFSRRHWINFDRGLILCNGCLYLGEDKNSHFVSLVERAAGAITAYRDHTRIKDFAPLVNQRGPVGWLELRHAGRLTAKDVKLGWVPQPFSRFTRDFPDIIDFQRNTVIDYSDWLKRLLFWGCARAARKARSVASVVLGSRIWLDR